MILIKEAKTENWRLIPPPAITGIFISGTDDEMKFTFSKESQLEPVVGVRSTMQWSNITWTDFANAQTWETFFTNGNKLPSSAIAAVSEEDLG